MTLDEAIAHAREKANGDGERAKEHKQLADWLEQLKMARESMFAQVPQMAQTIHENHELKAENDRLRELLSDIAEQQFHGDGYGIDGSWLERQLLDVGVKVGQ